MCERKIHKVINTLLTVIRGIKNHAVYAVGVDFILVYRIEVILLQRFNASTQGTGIRGLMRGMEPSPR